VKDQALEVLKNYKATVSGYDAAVSALKKSYGNKEKRKEVAVDKMLYLQAPSRNQASLNTFQLELIGIINELENLSVDVVGQNLSYVG